MGKSVGRLLKITLAEDKKPPEGRIHLGQCPKTNDGNIDYYAMPSVHVRLLVAEEEINKLNRLRKRHTNDNDSLSLTDTDLFVKPPTRTTFPVDGGVGEIHPRYLILTVSPCNTFNRTVLINTTANNTANTEGNSYGHRTRKGHG